MERDGRFHDVFVALVRDLVTAAEDVVGLPPHQKPLLMDFLAARIVRWQTALKAYGDGLSTEKRAGLFGELSVLGMLLAAGVKPAVVIDGWTGPKGAVQDFQHESLAIEVKASRQTQPANVRISSERQLDLKSGSRLLLIHVGLDERSDGSGMSLPGKVAELRQFVAPEHHVGLELDDRLMEYGYLDVHAPRYSNSSYIVRGLDCFDVRDPMPRILEKNLPSGVGRVAYDLSLAACEPYRLTDERVQAAFKEVSS
ncbi:hypothetical protein FHR75_004383 [Kineococcus radiotolerans]|uniref:Uncharacterized protein n=1 Tax=Kineococcus radiotolerans TaxID=131568 RepID=A0A7W4XYV6_KINRA|nr:hypothetical protein [Kineococcus radiotolerans]